MAENKFEIDDISLYKRICGYKDRNLKIVEDVFGVNLIPRGNIIIINNENKKGERVLKLLHLMGDYLHIKSPEYEFDEFDVTYLAKTIASGKNINVKEVDNLKIFIPDSGKTIVPRTINQAHYISTIHEKPITFSYGPAGTGKTYLAVAVAIQSFLSGKIDRIILTRPAVEAGESLGYLPGDLIQKINPYLRPLYDALFDLLPYERISNLMEKGSIEIAPLAYMRGRTLNKAVIILDEAQNTTSSQMKMFLTRLGASSKFIISGDITQIDLDKPGNSGLLHAMKILKGIKEIGFIKFENEDICRHPIVEKIVTAYEKHDKKSER